MWFYLRFTDRMKEAVLTSDTSIRYRFSAKVGRLSLTLSTRTTMVRVTWGHKTLHDVIFNNRFYMIDYTHCLLGL